MIIKDQVVEILIHKHNIGYYRSHGYKNLEIDTILYLNINDLKKGSNVKVDVKCDYCGKIVKVNYRDYNRYKYDKYSCIHCRQRKTSEYNLNQRQDVLYNKALKFCNKKGYKLITSKSEILNSDTQVIYECPKHGLHRTKIYTLITEHECIDCSYEKRGVNSRKTPNEVYNDFKKNGSILLNKEDYLGWNIKNLKVVCADCGDVFITSYNAFVKRNGQVCSKCASNISRGERVIRDFLTKNKVNFTMQFRFDDCRTFVPLPFDFYLYDYNICIEYDGEGHYIPINRGKISDLEAQELLENIKQRDKIKTQYCRDNNIKLIRIPYWEFDNIANILNKEIFT